MKTNTTQYVLLPQPAVLKSRPGFCRLPDPFVLPNLPAGLAEARWDLGLLAQALKAGGGLAVQSAAPGRPSLLRLDLRADGARPAALSTAAESYTLAIAAGGMTVSAHAMPGLRMGLRTLAQMAGQCADGRLPCVEISDQPALAFRGVHLDMKNVRYSLAYLEGIFDRLAAMKVNAVVLEYEDKFPFSRSLGVAGADAYSRREVQRIVAMLNARGMHAVPLQQCFGHMQYVLKHKRHAALRENQQHPGEVCPLAPGSTRLIKALLDEVAELHPDTPWFHMGGDEVGLGDCPRCKAQAAKSKLSGIYMDFVGPLVERMIAKGYQPLLWADVFLRYYEKNQALAGRVTLVDWNYGATEDAKSAWFWRGCGELTPDVFHNHFPDPAHPEHYQAFQRFFPKPGGSMDALYTTRYLRKQGYEVISAPAVSTGATGWFPKVEHGLKNVICHNRSAAAKGAIGTLTTRWSGGLPHWETAWPGMAAGAVFGWRPATLPTDFKRDFSRLVWGLKGAEVFKALALLTAESPMFSSVRWNEETYDGDLHARNIKAEIKAHGARQSAKELAATAGRARRNADKAQRMFAKLRKNASHNKFTLEYMELGARLLGLRAHEAELVAKAMGGDADARRGLVAAEKEARKIEAQTCALLAPCLSARSMRQFQTIYFAGEAGSLSDLGLWLPETMSR